MMVRRRILIKIRSLRLHVFTHHRLTLIGVLSPKVLLGHTKVLILELLDATFQGSIFISKLNQLRVNFVHRSCLRSYRIEIGPAPKLTILRITLLHNIFDLSGNQLIVVLAVRLEDALDELQAFPQSLVLDLALKAFRILLFEISLYLLYVVSQFCVGL